ncbi:MAG TPA: uroporphyrinogen decarboxylase [Candidatus Kapabacteria bacterium]|nr:uroporphyrinogen decarboxylase [Candidatus Kapabacteria bacterium]
MNAARTVPGFDLVPSKKRSTAGQALSFTSRERFLRACQCLPVDRVPAWIMRQAGRALPEYRKLKERYTFLELAQTPELAAEVTLQPIRRFGFDAAIIFSDILVIPEAMGVGYHFRETGGVEMDFAIKNERDIHRLSTDQIVEKLQYVTDAIRIVRGDLGDATALLGFAGSPWTLANYMLDGGSATEHTRALALFRENQKLFEALCEKLQVAVVSFLRMQIEAGVDAVQIFDSLGGLIPSQDFCAVSGRWIREIVSALGSAAPVIVFSKGTQDWRTLASTGADVIGVDHGTTLSAAHEALGNSIAVQGNLDPMSLVIDSPEMIGARVEVLLEEMRGKYGYIFNLGHGLPPNARLENIEALLNTIRTTGTSSAYPSKADFTTSSF